MSKDRIPYIEENTIDVAVAVNDSLRVVDGVVTDRVEAIVDVLPQEAKQSDKYAVNAGEKSGLIAKFVETDAGGFWEYFDSVLCELDGVVYVSDGKKWSDSLVLKSEFDKLKADVEELKTKLNEA